MSRDFYFNKWKETMKHLKEIIDMDMHYQVTKAHDAKLSDAVRRLTSVLGQYMVMYNRAIECFQHNLQVQKTEYMDNIIKALVSRILEIKHELEKLEGSRIQYIGYGLIQFHHTICDIEMDAIPKEVGRPEHIQAEFEVILARAKEKKEAMENPVEETEEVEDVQNMLNRLWDTDHTEEDIKDTHEVKEKVIKVPEEVRITREYLAMILAHEKTRQVIRSMNVSKLKREYWVKELSGQLKPPARYELREKSAQLICTVFRAYFELKRERIKTSKRDALLGLHICVTPNMNQQKNKAEEMLQNRSKLHMIYEKEWLARREHLKEDFLKRKTAQFCEEWREQIREWFMEWFESIQFFHDIPKVGSVAIFTGEIPSPYDWLEENKTLLIQNAANKKKSPQDLKFEKMEAKRQAMLLKREEQMKIRAEALLLKKMMKNPTMHPGYQYPPSKKSDHLLKLIDYYHMSWDMYDVWETVDVKEKYVHEVDVQHAVMEAKLEVLPKVDEHMRTELHKLKQALKEDYITNEEEMPVDVTKPIKGQKKKKILKTNITERVAEMIENLVLQGFIKEYPKIKIEDFIGDANFSGEDLRRQILPAFPFNFEIRAYWWERCREVCLGFRKILLVGPKCSGRTVLVQALASINNAVLFELDRHKVQGDMLSTTFLKRLVNNIVACARTLQPTVIHIKYAHKLFYTKIPPEEAAMNLPLLRNFFVQKLIKKIRKTDKITIIATCTDPWLAKSSTLLKQFPVVLLLPNTTYSLVVQLLKEWVIKHKVIPADFNVSNLAQVLQGYSFGYLKEVLDKFMSAERIAKIAAFGLHPMEVFNLIIDDETESKVEYNLYTKWYTEKTTWGNKEMQHLQDQRDFKAAVEKYAAKNKKKAKSVPNSATPSHTGL